MPKVNRVQQAADRMQEQADRARGARRKLGNPKWVESAISTVVVGGAVVAGALVLVPLLPALIAMAWGVFWIGVGVVILLLFLYN